MDGEDASQIKSSGFYNDLLDRPTEVWLNVAGGVAYSRARFLYEDTNRTITTQNDQSTVGDFAQNSMIKYDGLGRTFRNATYEGNTGRSRHKFQISCDRVCNSLASA